MIKAVRGTRDLLPPETALWNFVESAVRDVFRTYNFQEIRTPIFEETALFARSVGEETDVVAKEMYTWEDRGRAESEKGQSLTLRPENTAGVVRAYIEHKLWDRGLSKLYYIGPQFRRERPQKGRYRQFYQIGAEVIGPSAAGSESPSVDAEVIEMLCALLGRVGIRDWKLELNSIGDGKCRPVYNRALREALAGVIGDDRFGRAMQRAADEISTPVDVYIAPLGEGMDAEAARLARELRRDNVSVELGNESFRLKKSLETASKIGARYALILGEKEAGSGQFALKNLATGEQENVPRVELARRIGRKS